MDAQSTHPFFLSEITQCPFFDTHTHLDYLHHDTGEPLAQLVENAKQADVQKSLDSGSKRVGF